MMSFAGEGLTPCGYGNRPRCNVAQFFNLFEVSGQDISKLVKPIIGIRANAHDVARENVSLRRISAAWQACRCAKFQSLPKTQNISAAKEVASRNVSVGASLLNISSSNELLPPNRPRQTTTHSNSFPHNPNPPSIPPASPDSQQGARA